MPFSAFSSGSWVYGAQKLSRYNGVPAFDVQGTTAPGHSSGEAMDEMEKLVAKLPAGVGSEWTGISFEERLSGSQAPALYAVSLAVVFLCLAALYESWSIPVTVLLVVPLGILGAVIATLARGLSNDAFFQVGLLTTMGLAAKSAISSWSSRRTTTTRRNVDRRRDTGGAAAPAAHHHDFAGLHVRRAAAAIATGAVRVRRTQ